jgi:hypothetical protein
MIAVDAAQQIGEVDIVASLDGCLGHLDPVRLAPEVDMFGMLHIGPCIRGKSAAVNLPFVGVGLRFFCAVLDWGQRAASHACKIHAVVAIYRATTCIDKCVESPKMERCQPTPR